MVNTAENPAPLPDVDQIWCWLREVSDPEIPVVSVVDLGIVRDVRWENKESGRELVVTVTPTYSGCPATSVIALDIEHAIRTKGVDSVRLETQISPPWTTDWISEAGRERLKDFGITPPHRSRLLSGGAAAAAECPRCGSDNTVRVSEFGSTPCKALYRCRDCLEPFDLFKCL